MKFNSSLRLSAALAVALAASFANAATVNQDETLNWVAKQMNIKLDAKIAAPKVISTSDVSEQAFKAQCPSCGDKRISFYVPERNEIWITPGSDGSVLAAKYANFFQTKYFGATGDSASLEEESGAVQLAYRKAQLKKNPG